MFGFNSRGLTWAPAGHDRQQALRCPPSFVWRKLKVGVEVEAQEQKWLGLSVWVHNGCKIIWHSKGSVWPQRRLIQNTRSETFPAVSILVLPGISIAATNLVSQNNFFLILPHNASLHFNLLPLRTNSFGAWLFLQISIFCVRWWASFLFRLHVCKHKRMRGAQQRYDKQATTPWVKRLGLSRHQHADFVPLFGTKPK